MALRDIFPMMTQGSDLVAAKVMFKPKAGDPPILTYGPFVSSVVRADVGVYTITLKASVPYCFGTAVLNKPSGAAQYFGYFEHTSNSATITIKVLDATGTATDIDLSASGNIIVDFMVKQNPAAVH